MPHKTAAQIISNMIFKNDIVILSFEISKLLNQLIYDKIDNDVVAD